MFVGRVNNLEDLEALYERELPTLVVIKGRRRIGKSRLVNEFARKHGKGRFWSFAGLTPQEREIVEL